LSLLIHLGTYSIVSDDYNSFPSASARDMYKITSHAVKNEIALKTARKMHCKGSIQYYSASSSFLRNA
jgi:hypothetical protein